MSYVKPYQFTAKVYITSLNSHFAHLRLSTKYGKYSEVAKVWIKLCKMKFNEYGKKVYMITIKSTNTNMQLIFISLNEPLEYTNLCSHNHDNVRDST